MSLLFSAGCAMQPAHNSDPRFFSTVDVRTITVDTVNEGLQASVNGRDAQQSMQSTAVRGGARVLGSWLGNVLQNIDN